MLPLFPLSAGQHFIKGIGPLPILRMKPCRFHPPLFPLSAGQHFIKGIGPLANSQDETLQVSSASVSAVRRTAFLFYMERKFSRIVRPVSELFSGWN